MNLKNGAMFFYFLGFLGEPTVTKGSAHMVCLDTKDKAGCFGDRKSDLVCRKVIASA